MTRNVFRPAIQAMKDESSRVYGPIGFQDYLKNFELPPVRTAEVISVDHYSGLSSDLQSENCMVLRLGRSARKKCTQFALILRDDSNLEEAYFLQDHAPDLPPVVERCSGLQSFQEKAFDSFGRRSERNLVNYGLACGALQELLGTCHQTVASTGHMTSSFRFVPDSTQPNIVVEHRKGQVEIDAVLAAERNGENTLFVIEAKAANVKGLAKHKLMYGVEALRAEVGDSVAIVPVYLNCQVGPSFRTFSIQECTYQKDRDGLPILDTLQGLGWKSIRIMGSSRSI